MCENSAPYEDGRRRLIVRINLDGSVGYGSDTITGLASTFNRRCVARTGHSALSWVRLLYFLWRSVRTYDLALVCPDMDYSGRWVAVVI